MLDRVETTQLELKWPIDPETLKTLREIADKLWWSLVLPKTIVEKEMKRIEEEEIDINKQIGTYINYIITNGNSAFYVGQIIRLSKILNWKSIIVSLQQKYEWFLELWLDSTEIEINKDTLQILIKHLEQQTKKDYEASLWRNNLSKETRINIENNRDASLRKIEELKAMI